jgi:hypothetical protein
MKWMRRFRPEWVLWPVTLLLAWRFLRLISHYSVNILYWAEWEFNDGELFERHTWLETFRWQHGPHRQGLGALVTLWLQPLSSWDARIQDLTLGAIVVVATCAALLLKKRLTGSYSIFDVVIPLAFLTPASFETYTVVANPSHGPLPVLLIVLFGLAWTVNDLRLRYGLALIIDLFAVYTGFAIFLAVILPVFFPFVSWKCAREKDTKASRFALAASILAFLSLASFFIGYRFNPSVGCFSFSHNLVGYLHFTGLMLSRSIGIRRPQPLPTLAGALILLWMGLALLVGVRKFWQERERAGSRFAIEAILLAYCLLFCFNTAVGRLCLGMEASQTSRYIIYAAVGWFGLYLHSAAMKKDFLRYSFSAVLLLVWLVAAGFVHHGDRFEMEWYRRGKSAWKECYVQTHDISHCDSATGFPVYPWPERTHLKQKLDFLEERRLNLFRASPR